MRAVTGLAAVALATVACGSCKERKPAPAAEPAASGSAMPPRPRPAPTAGGDAAAAAPRPPPPGPVMTGVTLDEVKPVIPAVAGATVIDQPRMSPTREQVHLGWCIAGSDQAVAIAAIKAGLAKAGYGEPHERGQGARKALTADKLPFRLSASISASPRPGCSPAEKKWFASVSIYKIESVAKPPALEGSGAKPLTP